jgi:hypothetical protein
MPDARRIETGCPIVSQLALQLRIAALLQFDECLRAPTCVRTPGNRENQDG